MRNIVAGLVFGALAAMPAAAEDRLRPLVTADDSRGFEAIGRIDLGGRSFCTGTLVAEDLVLTAAHCLYDPDNRRSRDLSEIEFLAGWRDGRALAYRGVRRAFVHPDYVFAAPGEGAARVVNDVALLELDRPIRGNGIRPVDTGSKPRRGQPVSVVSYAVNREERPSLESACDVLARPADMLVISCTVDFGASGAPILAFVDGRPQIVSVVSAKAEAMGRPVSLGADIDGRIEALMAMARETPPAPGRLPVTRAAGSAGGSAKFIRP